MIPIIIFISDILLAIFCVVITRHFILKQSDGVLELNRNEYGVPQIGLKLKDFPGGKRKIILDVVDLMPPAEEYEDEQ